VVGVSLKLIIKLLIAGTTPMLRSRICIGFLLCAYGLAQPMPPLTQQCQRVSGTLLNLAANINCELRDDLTTRSPLTTPTDNSRADLPKGAFTPEQDQISPISLAERSRGKVAGIVVTGAEIGDAQSRWLLRIPENWNQRLVVAVPGGLGSEYSYDQVWSDFLLQRGYAYAATNKGTYQYRFTDPARDPHACSIAPAGEPLSQVFVHFYLHDAPDALPHWLSATFSTTRLAKIITAAAFGKRPKFTYLIGVSAGGWVVRRMLQQFPEEYDGGLEWEGVNWQTSGPNPAIDLPFALRAFLAYRQSNFDVHAPAYDELIQRGLPPDIFSKTRKSSTVGSFWETSANESWQRLACTLIFSVDPEYPGKPEDYDYLARTHINGSTLAAKLTTDGDIQRPLISLHGTMDSVLPVIQNGRSFRQQVVARNRGHLHRLYEIQNGNHYDEFALPPYGFTALEPIRPHAYQGFELLVSWVEASKQPPPGQCVPKGGRIIEISKKAGRHEHCEHMLD
jgi:pimeloyl-ACP methyl ester carboxylesterase